MIEGCPYAGDELYLLDGRLSTNLKRRCFDVGCRVCCSSLLVHRSNRVCRSKLYEIGACVVSRKVIVIGCAAKTKYAS
jgi:hypothetical protein